MSRCDVPADHQASSVLLVLPGEHGPEVHSGQLVDMADGRCTIRLAYPPGSSRSGGVLLIRSRDGEVAKLTAPITAASGSSQLVTVSFVRSVLHSRSYDRAGTGAAPAG